MWTYIDNFDKLPNINARAAYKDGVLRLYELYPVDGYVLHVPSGDFTEHNKDGNVILHEPYYTWGGATCAANYDFAANPEGYKSVLRSELPPDVFIS